MRSTPSVAPLSSSPPAAPPPAEPESLEQLIGDCRRMAEHWKMPATTADSAAAADGPSALRGVTVPAASAHVVEVMAEFGD
jgi:hypothetical protein